MNIVAQYWKYIATLLLGVFIGFYIAWTWFPRTITKEVTQEPIVQTQVVYKDKTEVSYSNKEGDESTDVEVNKAFPVVTVKVNGQITEMPLVQGEEHKFDKGKVIVNQSSALSVDVTAQVKSQVEQGINDAFARQARRPQYKVGIEGSVISADNAVNNDVNLRISRQSPSFDVDVRVNKDRKASLSVTKWL